MRKSEFKELVQLGLVNLSDEDRKTILGSGSQINYQGLPRFSQDELLDKMPVLDGKFRITVGRHGRDE